jgi:hypothetical protein
VTWFLGRGGSEAQFESWRRMSFGNGCARPDDSHDSGSSEHRLNMDELDDWILQPKLCTKTTFYGSYGIGDGMTRKYRHSAPPGGASCVRAEW